MLSLRCSTAERAVEHVMTESAPKYEGINPPAPHLPTVDSQLSARAQWSGCGPSTEHSAAKSDPACAGFSTAISVRRAEPPRAALETSKSRRVPPHSLC